MGALSRPARRACSTGESFAAGAVTITRHGALATTYLVMSPTKLSRGPPRPPSAEPPRIVDDREARAPGSHGRRRHLHAGVLLPHRLGPREYLARVLDLRFGQAR